MTTCKNYCCICGDGYDTYGKNPAPYVGIYHGKGVYRGEKCCDGCNLSCVIPARIGKFDKEARHSWRSKVLMEQAKQAREAIDAMEEEAGSNL